MFLKPAEIPTPPGDAFAGDKLGRKQSGLVLTQLLTTIQDPFVLTIEAGWGRGKTTFIRTWKQHLEDEGSQKTQPSFAGASPPHPQQGACPLHLFHL